MKLTRIVLHLVLAVSTAAFLTACADMRASDRDSGYNSYGGHSGHGGHH